MLRIKNWSIHFENNRSRDLKALDWVPVPNKMHGDGYTELVTHPNGAAHLGAWLAIVEIASRCVPRGTLIREPGKPHDAKSLARLSRLPASIFEEVIPRLLTIGWIESYDDPSEIPQEGAVKPQDDATQRPRKGIEWNGMEEKRRTPAAQDSAEVDKRPSAALLEIPCVPGRRSKEKTFRITQEMVDDWTLTYPAIDVLLVCRKALEWVKANPRNTKTHDRMRGWIGGVWCSREQDRFGKHSNAGRPPETEKQKRDREFNERIDREFSEKE